MNDIIDQIIRIDSHAYENKIENEELLIAKKKEYEDIVSNYKNERMEKAKLKVYNITEETDKFVFEIKESEKDEILKINTQIDKNYEKKEKELIEKVFKKIFVPEVV